jgi:ketosteroid isomerase-like protein
MQNRIFHITAVLFVLVTFIGLISGSGLAFAAGQDKAAINKVRLDFNAAFNEGNAEAMGLLIDREGVWMPPGEPAIVGKDNVVARYTDYFTKVRSKFELKPGEIMLCGDRAFMSGAFKRADTPKTGGAVKEVTGHYLFVLKKQPDGIWKIARDIWNEPVKP